MPPMLRAAVRSGLTAELPVEPNAPISVVGLLAGAVPPTQLLPVEKVLPTFAHSIVAACADWPSVRTASAKQRARPLRILVRVKRKPEVRGRRSEVRGRQKFIGLSSREERRIGAGRERGVNEISRII